MENFNMSVLSFDKPKKIRSSEEHNKKYVSDSGVDGTYVPNMSKEDTEKWKAKHIKGEDERIEIRKTFSSQLVIIVYKRPREIDWKPGNFTEWAKNHKNIKISVNGPIHLYWDDIIELLSAIEEAKDILGIGN
jgi:hypothetical protein